MEILYCTSVLGILWVESPPEKKRKREKEKEKKGRGSTDLASYVFNKSRTERDSVY